MKVFSVKFITRTALLLAVVVAVQMVGRLLPFNNFIVGPLVNACLVVSTAMLGIWGGLIVSVVSPFTSLINNHAPVAAALLPFAPFVAVGNFLMVLGYYLLRKKSQIAGVVTGAVLKFAFLWCAIVVFLRIFTFPKFAQALLKLFTWPQLITALIGGAVAILVIEALKKNMDMDS